MLHVLFILLVSLSCSHKTKPSTLGEVVVNQEGNSEEAEVIDLRSLIEKSKKNPTKIAPSENKIETYDEDTDELEIISLLHFLQSEEEMRFFDLGKISPRILKNYILPVNNKISSYFGMRNGKPHRGIDIPGPAGSPIKTSNEGTVVFSGVKKGYGKVIIISHNPKLFTLYAHNSKNLAIVGSKVKHGDIIALMGNTGKSTGPHVHFEVRENTKPIDPIKFIKNQKE